MKTYNPKSKCPKCGNVLVETHFRAGPSRLIRRCECCEYTWDEKPLDDESLDVYPMTDRITATKIRIDKVKGNLAWMIENTDGSMKPHLQDALDELMAI